MDTIVDENNQQVPYAKSQNQLKKSHTSIILILDIPPGIEIGLDCMHYEIGPKFRGFQHIPPGLHFIYHSCGLGPRQGFFLNLSKGEIALLSWDKKNEEIIMGHDLPDGSLENLYSSVCNGSLDDQLGPYQYSQLHLWTNISNYVSFRVLERAECPCGTVIYPGDVDELSPIYENTKPETTDKPDNYKTLKYTDIITIDKQKKKSFDSSTDITAYCLDRSALINSLLLENYDSSWEEMLGEIQLSFMMFLFLFSYPAIEHWKYIVHMISLSEDYMINNTSFASAFLRLFYEQLNFSPTDFFETELSRDNFLKPVLTNLLHSTESNQITDPTLLEHRKRFINFLRKKFSLFDEDSNIDITGHSIFDLVEEDYPVVVNLEADEVNYPMDVTASPVSIDTCESSFNVSQSFSSHYPSPSPSSSRSMSQHEINCAMYSWRYPFLYDAMQTGEDMIMAATRIIDESPSELALIEGLLNKKQPLPIDVATKRVNEAYIFMRDEISARVA